MSRRKEPITFGIPRVTSDMIWGEIVEIAKDAAESVTERTTDTDLAEGKWASAWDVVKDANQDEWKINVVIDTYRNHDRYMDAVIDVHKFVSDAGEAILQEWEREEAAKLEETKWD